jgi:hypothetical protein
MHLIAQGSQQHLLENYHARIAAWWVTHLYGQMPMVSAAVDSDS